jgi:Protein of unknown function (DUF2844)
MASALSNYFCEAGGRNFIMPMEGWSGWSARFKALLLISFFLILPLSAFAALGDNAASVLADLARMKGTLRSVDARSYVMHEITLQSGAVVREFVSPAGAVFGVAWEGPFAPDLQQLLGPYYQQAKQAVQSQQQRRRAPIVVETPGLVFVETGHPRSFHGQAYIPLLVPQGVEASAIH